MQILPRSHSTLCMSGGHSVKVSAVALRCNELARHTGDQHSFVVALIAFFLFSSMFLQRCAKQL
eukprot:SAG31_NODE_1776_length_7300_cov_10.281905_3_plen_64_part_00